MRADPFSLTAGDLDGDGLLDLVAANARSDTLAVFLQTAPGRFPSSPQFRLGGSAAMVAPVSVVAADLNKDGLLDLISANAGSHALTVFFQLAPGEYTSIPIELGGPATTNDAFAVAAADLDGDGVPDLVSANRVGGSLTLFFGGR